jgi:hypothetical protein
MISAGLVMVIADAFFDLLRPAERRVLFGALGVAAGVIYLSALGYLPDIYRWGYLPVPIVLVALVGIIVAEWSVPIALFILCGFAAFDAGLLPSRNLFDYFIDPLSAAYCLVRLALPLIRASRTISPQAGRRTT